MHLYRKVKSVVRARYKSIRNMFYFNQMPISTSENKTPQASHPLIFCLKKQRALCACDCFCFRSCYDPLNSWINKARIQLCQKATRSSLRNKQSNHRVVCLWLQLLVLLRTRTYIKLTYFPNNYFKTSTIVRRPFMFLTETGKNPGKVLASSGSSPRTLGGGKIV